MKSTKKTIMQIEVENTKIGIFSERKDKKR